MHLFCFGRRVSQNGFAEKERWGKILNFWVGLSVGNFYFQSVFVLSSCSENVSRDVVFFFPLVANGSGLCEVAENRRRKIRFRRQEAKANFYLLNYKKKPIKLAFADYEAQSFNLAETPPFCKTLVACCPFQLLFIVRLFLCKSITSYRTSP